MMIMKWYKGQITLQGIEMPGVKLLDFTLTFYTVQTEQRSCVHSAIVTTNKTVSNAKMLFL